MIEEVFDDVLLLRTIYVLVGFAVLFLLFIFYVRFSYVRERRWRRSVRSLCQQLLARYVNLHEEEEIAAVRKRIKKVANLHEEEEIAAVRKRIKKVANSPEKRQILLEEVIELYNNFNGVASDRVKKLYKEMRLYELSVRKVESFIWHENIEGIVELSLMNYGKGVKYIRPLLLHSNREVRRKAKIAIVELNKIEGLRELAELPEEMSDWTYLSILSILKRSHSKINTTDLQVLKESESQSIRSLAGHLEKYMLVS